MNAANLSQRCVSIDKSAQVGIIVAGLEVVQAGFSVVNIAPVAQGIGQAEGACHGAAGGKQPAPGIVSILYYQRTGAVEDALHIAPGIHQVIVPIPVMKDHHGVAHHIVGKVVHCAVFPHLGQLTIGVNVLVGACPVGTLGAQAPGFIGEIPGARTVPHGFKLPAMLPGVGINTIIGQIADGVVGEGSAVIARQQIALRIAFLGAPSCEGAAFFFE